MPYYYHLAIGWCDESPWKIPDIENCLQQFEKVNLSKCRFLESEEVRSGICNLFREAIRKNGGAVSYCIYCVKTKFLSDAAQKKNWSYSIMLWNCGSVDGQF